MLHASETWPLTKTNLQHLQRIDSAMIRQICSIKPEVVATVRSSQLLARLELEDLENLRLHWFGYVKRSSGAVRTACDVNRLMAGGGHGGPSQHGRNRRRKTAVRGSSQQLTLKKGAPGDQDWCEICYAGS